MTKLCCHAALNQHCLMCLDTKPVSLACRAKKNIQECPRCALEYALLSRIFGKAGADPGVSIGKATSLLYL